MPYSIYNNEFYKIWFSKNPDQALGIENELALVRLRVKHPNARITLVYSSACLTELAQSQLKIFCGKHNIQLFDFDTDLKTAIMQAVDPESTVIHLDPPLYDLAQEEILNTLHTQGGNLASASDITRLLEPVAVLGMYGDFDIELDFSHCTQDTISCASAILVQADSDPVVSLNNEFIAVAKINQHTLHPDARAQLNEVKGAILNNYILPQDALFAGLIKNDVESWTKNPMLHMPIILFFDAHPDLMIYHFREYVQQLTLSQIFSYLQADTSQEILKQPYSNTLTEEEIMTRYGEYLMQSHNKKRKGNNSTLEMQPITSYAGIESTAYQTGYHELQILKHILYKKSVTQLSGPTTLRRLIKNIDNYEVPLTRKQGRILERQFDKLSVGKSDFAGCILSNNTKEALQKPGAQNKKGMERIGLFGHQAWTPIGAQNKEKRENKMNKAAGQIQNLWRNYKKRQNNTDFCMHLVTNIVNQPTSVTDTDDALNLSVSAKRSAPNVQHSQNKKMKK